MCQEKHVIYVCAETTLCLFVFFQDGSLVMDLQEMVSCLPPLQCTSLANSDIMRYSRQLLLPELGVKGENLIKQKFKTVFFNTHKQHVSYSFQVS